MHPHQKDPQIEEQERYAHIEESYNGILGGGTDSTLMLQTITGLNTKALPIAVWEALQSERDVGDGIGLILDTVPAVFPLPVRADDPDLEGDAAVF